MAGEHENGEAVAPGQEHAAAVGPGQEHGDSVGPGQEHAAAGGPGQEHGAAGGPGQEHNDSVGSGQEHAAAIGPGQEHGAAGGSGQEHGAAPGHEHTHAYAVERTAEVGDGSPLWAGPGEGLVVPGYRRDHEAVDPPGDFPEYRGTIARHPKRPLVPIPDLLTEVTGPLLGEDRIGDADFDLTAGQGGEPQGQKIVLHGRVLDGNGRPIRGTLVEIWQANAAGRYWHAWDNHPAPLDPHFEGVGRCLTDDEGRYRFVTIKPGSYPWGNHFNAWRPAHIHLSLFGRAFTQRLVTQMYFPGDPMFDHDPIFNSVREPADRARLIAAFDWEATTPAWALGYRFDIVLRGREGTPFEEQEVGGGSVG